ncbi:phosphate ABC transporter membrane protein 2, PhoT family [Loktanella fryxellensis]|uniref:Phosphate transport system permease protein PstA n=1 Tax=Loktanella fryxellensis TaxID=245187 RepID=A0A1H8CCS2_9RHOB|nr:phosphate ABC transporter permease PstA [Loktanella fryxellensis]SEM92845.1 phosphate ABC transporter membrane protein 2, PhoT family [Loktanella fryxellensis]
MTDAIATGIPAAGPRRSILIEDALTRKRNRSERRFKMYGLGAITISLLVLFVMLFTIFRDGYTAFFQASLTFPVTLDAEALDENGNRDPAELAGVTTIGYGNLLRAALIQHLNAEGIDLGGVSEADVGALISRDGPAQLRDQVLADPDLIGQTIELQTLATSRLDGYLKGRVTMETALLDSNISPEQLQLADRLSEAGIMTTAFNPGFLTLPDASDQRPEAAGLGVAIIGSLYMMFLVLIMTLPIGVAASIYLEEFAPKNWFTDIIEVNISNLAAVPSIVFGILGLALFINFAGMPASSTLVGALVLTLMTLPTIIIATRASLRAVPPSIRDAALGVGASKMQTVFHHVLPLAMPGILTGTILGLATALGETAPLLLIGMVAFVNSYPAPPLDGGFLDPATALPVQVYSWASRSDPAFLERSSGAIIVLLAFLVVMNAVAIILRRRFERRW